MSYSVKEIFYTLQGEGTHTGRAAVFCRFSGCNLWSGHEKTRKTAICQFCDTDFVGTDGPGGGRFKTADSLAKSVMNTWSGDGRPFVVCTGGEPLLQLDAKLIEAFHSLGIEIAVETNGTILPPDGIDHICVSPKAGSQLILTSGHELKLVYPQDGLDPKQYASMDFNRFYLQPKDGPNRDKNTHAAVEYCLKNPFWRLSVQTHKDIGIP